MKITAKGKLDIFKKCLGVEGKVTPEGNIEGMVECSGLKITILQTRRKYVIIQVAYEYEEKEFSVMSPVELTQGQSHTICVGDNFKIQAKVTLS
jgi:hypothetical protein